jgi:hypothetical protein
MIHALAVCIASIALLIASTPVDATEVTRE